MIDQDGLSFPSKQVKVEEADDNNDETFGEGASGPDDNGLGGIGMGVGGLRVSDLGLEERGIFRSLQCVIG